jgi:predicted RNA methylase
MRKFSSLFSNIPLSLQQQLQIDAVARYSVTECTVADEMTNILIKLPNVSTITDMTACVGGNAISFAKRFHTVHAIELDETRYKMLLHNTGLTTSGNVVCHLGDCMECRAMFEQDIYFIDPPWGGASYRKNTNIALFLNGMPLCDVVNLLVPSAKYIAIKAPLKFALFDFQMNVNLRMSIHRFRNMMLVVIACP